MIILLSPAKTLDFKRPIPKVKFSNPLFQKDASELVKTILPMGKKGIKNIMKLSDKLADLNNQRFNNFKEKVDINNSRPAIFSFNGDVYEGLNIASFSKADILYAQRNLRILSGLYGILKPLDLIQPYRLEMGTKLKNPKGKNLYDWWGKKIADQLFDDLKDHTSPIVINLASEEYFKSVKKNLVNECVYPIFQDYVSGKYRTVGVYAKRARGLMASYILKNKIDKLQSLKEFNCEGYEFAYEESSENKLFFRRKK